MDSYEKLKSDVKNKSIQNLYIFHGVEDYMKNFYLKKIEDSLLDENFKSFNLEKFDDLSFNIDEFYNAVESLPAMSDKKLIIVRDIDIFKLKSDDRDKMIEIFSDIPPYTTVIFDYATFEFKPDNRQKLGKIIKSNCEVVEFKYLSTKEINTWITKRFLASDLKINVNTLEFLTFTCSYSMTNLSSEIDKLCVYSKDEVSKKDIEDVCTKVLEAKIFDVTDRLLKKDIIGTMALIDDLFMLNVDEFSIVSVINAQFQRLYSAKLGINRKLNEKYFMDLWGIYSSYAIKINLNQAKILDLEVLKKACNLCVNSAIDMVSKNFEKGEIINHLIVKIGTLL